MRISAIVPTCDRPTLLARALRSIAAQELAPDEVVVVVDGDAPDAIEAAVAAATAAGLTRTAVVRNRGARGASGARNTGASVARGETLAFLDDDDEWLPPYLREMTGLMRERDLDLTCADLLYKYESEAERPGKKAPERLAPELFLTRNPGLGGSNFVLRGALFHAVGGFDESLPTMNDLDFGLRLSLRGGVRYEPLHRSLVRVYFHEGPKLSTPGTALKHDSVRRYLVLHGHLMTDAQLEDFRTRSSLVWKVDASAFALE